jgi:hypothetical protein
MTSVTFAYFQAYPSSRFLRVLAMRPSMKLVPAYMRNASVGGTGSCCDPNSRLVIDTTLIEIG